MARQPLGRGLSALLGDEKPAEANFDVGIDQLEPNPQQPRSRFSETALDDLAASITANGIVQPILVRKKGDRYQIIAGERRWRAAQRAGLRRVPVTVREIEDDKLLELALVENIQREELNPVEEARAYRKLIDTIGLTQEALAATVGRERSLIATSLRLLKLPAEVLEIIEEGKLTAGHGRALLLVEDPAAQRRAARTAVEMAFSVRETERFIKRSGKSTTQAIGNKQVRGKRDANLIAAESKLRRRFSTGVKILPANDGKGGRIEIEYYSDGDLDRIYQMLIDQSE
ncbi:MAG: ParB/RepB/Spo0J family partition protein [Pyrinomonadaceae bacterium]